MSEREAQERGLRLVPAWGPFVWTLLAAVAAGGATYGTNQAVNAAQDRRLEALESQASRANERYETILTKLSRIEGKLGMDR